VDGLVVPGTLVKPAAGGGLPGFPPDAGTTLPGLRLADGRGRHAVTDETFSTRLPHSNPATPCTEHPPTCPTELNGGGRNGGGWCATQFALLIVGRQQWARRLPDRERGLTGYHMTLRFRPSPYLVHANLTRGHLPAAELPQTMSDVARVPNQFPPPQTATTWA